MSNLQLARATTRQRELAVRLAVGADRGRLTRQLLAEAVVLSLAAAALGVGIALAGVRALVALQPANVPRVDGIAVDATVLAFAVGVAVVTALALGFATALRASHARIRETLSEEQRTVTGGSERLRQGLAVAQVALTVVLLAGAGLLTRSFLRLLDVDPGFRTDGALVLDLTWTFAAEPELRQRRMRAQQEIVSRIGALPGVHEAGLVSVFPIGPGNFNNGQFLEMTRPDEIQSFEDFARLAVEAKSRAGFAAYRIASGGYFTSMGIPLVRGRLFDDRDGPDAPHVAVISESLARAKWPDQDPLGRFVQFGNMDGDLRSFQIVGIVGDVREVTTETLPGPIFYGHYQQRFASRASIVARAASPDSLGPGARHMVRQVDPDVPIQVRTVDDALARARAGRRFSLTLIGAFSMVALVLATLGIYGLVSYLVAQRTREFGIRLALGAEAGDVLKLVLGKARCWRSAGLPSGSVSRSRSRKCSRACCSASRPPIQRPSGPWCS